jgi:DNA recombination-dependent growth factor C
LCVFLYQSFFLILNLVAAIDIYMSDIQQILGDENATTWLIEWIEGKPVSDSVKILDECELDALRGESATCGLCSNNIDEYLTPTKCDNQKKFDSLDILWRNTDCE